jgi:uncharacterized heparinase superfamily protein
VLKKTRLLSVRLSEHEYEQLVRDSAAHQAASVSEYARSRLSVGANNQLMASTLQDVISGLTAALNSLTRELRNGGHQIFRSGGG